MLTLVGLLATLAEIIIGATLQQRLPWLSNELVNGLQTLLAALLAMASAAALGGGLLAMGSAAALGGRLLALDSAAAQGVGLLAMVSTPWLLAVSWAVS